MFLSGKEIVSYLQQLETGDVKLQEVDFQNLTTAAPAAAATAGAEKAPVKEKEEAKIEGAVQIAIGVKKEVDFATWYTNVSGSKKIPITPVSRLFQVLLKADMLDYYSVSGCYILKPWSYSIWEEIQRTSISLVFVRFDSTPSIRMVQRRDQGAGSAKLVFPHVRIAESPRA